MGRQRSDFYNAEGYPDPTAYRAIQAETNLENKVSLLIQVLKSVVSICGFEVVNRIELVDKKTGRHFK